MGTRNYFEDLKFGRLNPLIDNVPPVNYWLSSNKIPDDLKSCLRNFVADASLCKKTHRLNVSVDRIAFLMLAHLYPFGRVQFDNEIDRVREKFARKSEREKIRKTLQSLKTILPDLYDAQLWCEVLNNHGLFEKDVSGYDFSEPYMALILAINTNLENIEFIKEDLRNQKDEQFRYRGAPRHPYVCLQSHLQRILSVNKPRKTKKTAHAALISEIFSHFGIDRAPNNIIRDLHRFSFLSPLPK